MKVLVDYPTKEEEIKILEMREEGKAVKTVTSAREIVRLSKEVEKVYVGEPEGLHRPSTHGKGSCRSSRKGFRNSR
jgi:hypothetical protein